MTGEPEPKFGFQSVDTAPDPAQLLAGMDSLSGDPAVQRLRAWEAARLALQPGETLLDVGCGPGTAAIALAPSVGAGGRVIGLDFSATMAAAAAERAADLTQCVFRTGDATALDLADGEVDAYRSERTYQWLDDPDRAWAEAFRVLRPGGRVSVIDTDWGTRAMDLGGETAAVELVADLMPPSPNPLSGRRLLNQARDAGFTDLTLTAETLLFTSWDPDAGPGVPGVIPFPLIAQFLVLSGRVDEAGAAAWLARIEAAARADRFYYAATVIGVAGRRPV